MFPKTLGLKLSSFKEDINGTIAIMSAGLLMVGIGAAAIAVDIGSLYTERRTLQGVADLAAMTAASNIDNAEALVTGMLAANSIEATFDIERGKYTPDPKRSHETRFEPGATPHNALRVNLSHFGTTYFARALTQEPIKISVQATAATSALASFSIGSRLLAVRNGIANTVLGELLGTSISLSVMDYEALVTGNIELLAFSKALATKANLQAATFNDVLDSNVSVGDIVSAMSTVTSQNGDATLTAALNRLMQGGGLTKKVPLSSLINLGPYGMLSLDDPHPGLSPTVAAMQMVSGVASLANTKNQVSIAIGANVPNLLSLRLDVAIGEPPQHSSLISVGLRGAIVRTAQTRLRLLAEVGGQGVLQSAKIKVPLYLDLAYGEAKLSDVSCAGANKSARIAARPGVVAAWIGDPSGFTDFTSTASVGWAKLVDTLLIDVRGRAHVDITNTNDDVLTFDENDVRNKTIKRTETRDVTQSLVASLLSDLSLSVNVFGLSLTTPTLVASALRQALNPLTGTLDDVIQSVTSILGVHLGEVDVQVHDIRCGSGVLAG